ncbi:MAG TPA: Gfo/Idh/MocA family oxidoreductase [Opitutaceae bacterium]|nr:Gfo/Idh/MocA family oxidoreductase [Opitutaceae bacterium]
MEKLRTALVGAGRVAHLHAAALRALPESQFVAVCSRPSERLSAFAARYGVPAFTDVAQMVDRARVQALCVCTPHPGHAAPTIAAARAGVHVLVEKPMASSLSDCDAMIAAAQAGGAVIGMVSQRRLYPPCQRIRRALDEGLLGRPVLGTATILGWRDEAYYRSDPWRGTWTGEGGGVLVNQAPHQLDLLLWYMGEVAEVSGYWANLNHPYIEVDDTAVASVRFKSGALGSILVSNSQNPGINARVSVHGANGASAGVQTDGGAMFVAGSTRIADAPFNDIWTIPGQEGLVARWKDEDAALFRGCDPMQHFHGLQIADFLRAVLEARPPAVTAADGRRTVELFTSIYRAARDDWPARFPLPAE